MKIFPLILAAILLLSGLYPCKEGLVCQEAKATQTDTCLATEDKHSCCSSSTEEDHAPAEKKPCAEGCPCYCCVPVIAPPTGVPSLFVQLEPDWQKPWKASIYAHDFTHLIWHPPQAG